MNKKITIDQFISLLKTAKITTRYEPVETEFNDGRKDRSGFNHDNTFQFLQEYAEREIAMGWIWNELVADGLIFEYHHIYYCPEDCPEEAEAFDEAPEEWRFEQQMFSVVDEDGDEIAEVELSEIILDNTNIKNFDLSVLRYPATL